MSILIKDMCLPINCFNCYYCTYGFCELIEDNISDSSKRDDRCPLIEIPAADVVERSELELERSALRALDELFQKTAKELASTEQENERLHAELGKAIRELASTRSSLKFALDTLFKGGRMDGEP